MPCLNRSEFKRVSYEGFYTVVLEKDGEMISAALLRSGSIQYFFSSVFTCIVTYCGASTVLMREILSSLYPSNKAAAGNDAV
jgi:hypothetical protein